jgi:hypothetical protein
MTVAGFEGEGVTVAGRRLEARGRGPDGRRLRSEGERSARAALTRPRSARVAGFEGESEGETPPDCDPGIASTIILFVSVLYQRFNISVFYELSSQRSFMYPARSIRKVYD